MLASLSAAAGTVAAVGITLSSPTAGAQATYTVTFTTSQSGDLHKGNTIVITAARGTVFSGRVSDVTATTTFNARTVPVAVSSVTTAPAQLTVVVGTEIHKGAGMSLSLSAVRNPTVTGTYQLSVATTADAAPMSSPAYSVLAAAPARAWGLTYQSPSVSPGHADAVASSPVVADGSGNVLSTTGTYSVSGAGSGVTVDPASGLVTAGSGASLGTWTVTFTQGAASTSASVVVEAGAPADASGLGYASDTLVPPGTDAVASAPVVTDASGNPVATNGTYSISGAGSGVTVDPASGLVTAASGASLGTWTVTFTQGAASTSASIVVEAGAPANASGLSYASPMLVPPGTDAVASAPVVTDASGNPIATNGAYSVSGAGSGVTVDPASGLVTAASGASLGTWTVTFTQGAASTSASIVVEAGAPADASGLSYASDTLVPPGTDAVASAPVVTDASGNPVATNGTYSISGAGSGVTVDPASGLVTAASGASLGTWTVTFTQGSATTSAQILVRGRQSSLATTTLTLTSPSVSTFAGNTGTTNVNGTGTGASFSTMGGEAIVGGGLYVGSKTAVRRVDLVTGAVSTLAGDLSLSGCTDSATASAVRFQNIGDVTTDGIFLYVVDCGKVRRVSLSSGATSTVASTLQGGTPRFLTFGPDGNLYVVADTNAFACTSFCSWTLDRLNPISGVAAAFTTTVGGRFADAVTSDASALWVHENNTGNIYRFDVSIGTETLLTSGPGATALTSAGSYLYATSGTSITRIDKTSGAQLVIAGSATKGWADGPGASALFSAVTGLASDGSSLWVADSGNHRIRQIH